MMVSKRRTKRRVEDLVAILGLTLKPPKETPKKRDPRKKKFVRRCWFRAG